MTLPTLLLSVLIALFYGTFDPAEQQQQRRGEQLSVKLLESPKESKATVLSASQE